MHDAVGIFPDGGPDHLDALLHRCGDDLLLLRQWQHLRALELGVRPHYCCPEDLVGHGVDLNLVVGDDALL